MTHAGDNAVLVTEDSVDPLFQDPYIEVDEQRASPVPHRYVHGGFKNSAARFSFYFPPASSYQGRFHHNTYPLATSSDVGPFPIAFDVATGNLAFTLDSGAYYVQTNNGGAFRSGEPSVAAYRANAAAAKFSRVVANQMYGSHRPFGYLYGGSGGAYQTIGGAEHTSGVWDGFMPFVLGCNNAVPSLWAVRLHLLRVLRKRDKLDSVLDAINPGGSGDMYASLNEEERAALDEALLMGFPPRGLYNHRELHHGYFSDVFGVIPAIDPTYATDFWSKAGYLGHDAPASFAADRIEFETTVARVIDESPRRIVLSDAPEVDLSAAHSTLLSGAAKGKWLHIAVVDGKSIGFASTSDPSVVAQIREGDRVRIDNSWLLAAQTYQRHQVPPDESEYGWNQFRAKDGTPRYPQRELLIGHSFALNSVGSLLTGRINGKMLLVQALMDIDALPWCADWYRSEVGKALGADAEQQFALWFIDRAQHDNPKSDISRAHTVDLAGSLQQGLRDLARWVEKGVRPADTRYRMNQSQVEISSLADERGGVQTVVELEANNSARAKVAVGEAVTFIATAEVPPGTGKIIACEWDYEGTGHASVAADFIAAQTKVRITGSHIYTTPDTYYPVVRVTSQREGDAQTAHARIQNIARARVIVS